MNDSEILRLHATCLALGIGPESLARRYRLSELRGDAPRQIAQKLSSTDRRITPRMVEEIWRSFDEQKVKDTLAQDRITLVGANDPLFPIKLTHIARPPLWLYVRAAQPEARLEEFQSRSRIAIVGARACSEYGRRSAAKLAGALAEAGVWVVSGLALGIDTAAHEGALKVNGLSAGVLGTGVCLSYPKRNTRLAQLLIEKGLLFSEFLPHTPPSPWHFPVRNRIIAGLCDGVVVVEARKASGALLTAQQALEEGREVYAVPGSINSELSTGPHALIADGAKLVSGAKDILEDFGLSAGVHGEIKGGAEPPLPPLAPKQALIYKTLEAEPLPVETLATLTGLSAQETVSGLSHLEVFGLARRQAGNLYCKGAL